MPVNLKKIAILIKTYNRPHRLIETITSIKKFAREPYRIYIGDDGDISDEVACLYSELRSEGHVVRIYPDRVNVTTARNDLIGLLETENFVLRLDDDFNFTAETNISAMLAIMKSRPEIGAISDLERQLGDGKKTKSGDISSKQGHMVLRDGVLYKLSVPHTEWLYSTAAGFRFSYANFTRNFLLIRRQVFETVKWNEDIAIQGEHTAFMLDLQAAGWTLAFTPESIHSHNESNAINTQLYTATRHAPETRNIQKEVFLATYGIASMQGVKSEDLLNSTEAKRGLRSSFKKLLTKKKRNAIPAT